MALARGEDPACSPSIVMNENREDIIVISDDEAGPTPAPHLQADPEELVRYGVVEQRNDFINTESVLILTSQARSRSSWQNCESLPVVVHIKPPPPGRLSTAVQEDVAETRRISQSLAAESFPVTDKLLLQSCQVAGDVGESAGSSLSDAESGMESPTSLVSPLRDRAENFVQQNLLGPELVPNAHAFECAICFSQVPVGSGVVLRACLHPFCKDCLVSLIKFCDRLEVNCPFAGGGTCQSRLSDMEIRALSSQEVLDRRASLSLRLAGLDVATGELWPSLTETVMCDLVSNQVRFECPMCFCIVAPGAGVVLKDCLHAFCRACLTDVVDDSCTEPIPCPCTSSDYLCQGHLLQEEVRVLVGPSVYSRYLARSLQSGRAHEPMLSELEAAAEKELAPNVGVIECPICFCDVEPNVGVTLHGCLHSFCRPCLAELVRHCEVPSVGCPFVSDEYSCQNTLTEREIRALVSADVYERHLARSLNQAESSTAGSFHCQSAGCAGWCELEDTVNAFCCPVCIKVNCITCRAIHEYISCRAYQRKVAEDSRHNEEARKTQRHIEEMLAKRQAIHCPVCAVIIMKKSGCDWLVCSACRKEICWVTGKARWGPRGQGDTSAGCRCRVGGKLCHPSCGNCH